MEVTFTGSWYDETGEKEGAQKLIDNGCVLISQHADSMGAPTACELAGVPNVSYNGSTISACPNTYLISSRIDWTPYFEYAISAVANGTAIDPDWTGTLATGSVVLTDLNTDVAAEGTAEAIEEAMAKLEDGSLHVFDTSTFTVDGQNLDSYMADVDTDPTTPPIRKPFPMAISTSPSTVLLLISTCGSMALPCWTKPTNLLAGCAGGDAG